MKNVKAIVNSRVSTAEQLTNNSLNRQLESVEKAAQKLGAVIPQDGRWAGSVSSKAGTNITRKDLLEMLEYCKKDKEVEYAIFDEYDRYMRSVNEGPYFEVLFQQLGVKVWYASESDAFNGDDAMAKFMRTMSAFRAEGSNEERQKKSISGHEKAIREGRYTFPPKPGYQKGTEPGVHVPHPVTFEHLQRAFEDVVSGIYTPLEALKRLNRTDFAKVHSKWRMDKFRRYATDPYYAGILVKDLQVKARNEQGQHQKMISPEEHEQLVKIFSGTLELRGHKKQYNPDFPMNKLMVCGDCGNEVKFTGSTKNNGRNRKTTTYYHKYHCRGCGKSYHRDEVHNAITERLQEIVYAGHQEADFIEAMTEVWEKKQSDKLVTIRQLEKKAKELEGTKSKMVRELVSAEPDYKKDIKSEIDSVKQQIEDTKEQIGKLSDLEQDLLDFLRFGLDYTNELVEDWWQLTHEDRVRCQQLIFPGGISFNSDKKVGTSQLSPIYSLKPNKKALDHVSKALMVELVGTAPTSAGLSWLIVYRLRSFRNS